MVDSNSTGIVHAINLFHEVGNEIVFPLLEPPHICFPRINRPSAQCHRKTRKHGHGQSWIHCK
jgi:hypothetical protein